MRRSHAVTGLVGPSRRLRREAPAQVDGRYAAFVAKDARFDGRFFVGIFTTKIYCRPICKAKQPKPENCTFYETAAAAERAGYRPCLLCRPELAPGSSIADAGTDLAFRAAKLLRENCGSGLSLDDLAQRLGCTDRHLRRVFTAEYKVSPVQYLQTCKLLLAKGLLTDTNLSVLDVAMASGFGSLRRLNDLFKQRYQLSPTALRRRVLGGEGRDGAVTLALSYRPPYPWKGMLRFLAGRAISGVELVTNDEYLRNARLVTPDGKHVSGWIRVGHRPAKNALTVTVGDTLLPALPRVLTRVRHLFDLHCDPSSVYEVLQSMNELRPNLCVLGTRLPGCFDTFEMAVRAVLGQQITVKAASTLASRIVQTYGTSVQTGIEGLTHLFPSPADLLSLEGSIENHLGPLGVTGARARTILELAEAMAKRKIDFELPSRPEEEIERLLAIRGIGSWTAQYIAMRALEWPDAFLETDAGVRKALPGYTPKELLELAERWRPWRSYATVNLWNTL